MTKGNVHKTGERVKIEVRGLVGFNSFLGVFLLLMLMRKPLPAFISVVQI